MLYKLILTDSAGAHELPPLEVPLTVVKNEKMTTVEPLSGNVYDDYLATKRAWAQTWSYLSKEQYDLLEEIYERMKSEYTYPRLTIEAENVTNLVVKFTLGAKNIIDNCGEVQDVTVGFFETKQLGT